MSRLNLSKDKQQNTPNLSCAFVMLLKFRTEGYNGYSLQWSPFYENKLAVVSAANYGLVGNGRLYILRTGQGPAGIDFDTQDGLFDVAWSEVNEHQLVTASGDGSIKLWDATLADFPIQQWQEHQREVFSVNWNMVTKDSFLSGSWDHTIKLASRNSDNSGIGIDWNPLASKSLVTFAEHTHCVYNATWCPHAPHVFASASGDQTIKIWDANQHKSVQTIHAHNNEILSLDWSKYQDNTLVTGSVDQTIKVWDLRRPDRELACLRGHEYAVRRVVCSPHMGNIVASASYDMSMRLWDIPSASMIHVHDLHTEFVLGLDFNLYVQGQMATCGWDEMIHVFIPPALT